MVWRIIFIITCVALMIWYFFWLLPRIVDQGIKDFKEWRNKPDTTIVYKNGHYDTTITIKK